MSIESIKKKSLEEHIPIIMDDTLEVIKKILKEEKPVRILEIGTATGYSSICFATILLNNSIDEEASSILIDTIELDETRANEAIKNIKEMKLENTINVFIGNAVEILPTFNEKYDIIFIDAAKGKYPVFLKEALRLSHKNSIILADNILYKGYVMSDYNKHKQRTAVTHLREYIKEVTEDNNLETKILEVGDGLAISKVLI
ncbi:MAG: O-methyltransferase [Clostridia bacterium]